jgi:hypothetical protein
LDVEQIYLDVVVNSKPTADTLVRDSRQGQFLPQHSLQVRKKVARNLEMSGVLIDDLGLASALQQ